MPSSTLGVLAACLSDYEPMLLDSGVFLTLRKDAKLVLLIYSLIFAPA